MTLTHAETGAEWAGAAQLRADLDAMGLPATLRDQIDYSEARPWLDPARAGCGSPCGLGTARIMGQFRLGEWAEAGALGHTGPAEAAALDTIAGLLRGAGEGCRVLWHLELIHKGWLGGVRGPALLVDALICVGPHLPAATIAEIDDLLAALPGGWGRHDAIRVGPQTTNAPVEVHGVGCWCTEWTALIRPDHE